MKITRPRAILVNYDFPPNEGIGGRRWGFLANELSKHFELIVIKAEPKSKEKISSQIPIDTGIEVISLPRTYPEVLIAEVKTLGQKLRYQAAIRFLKLTHKGTIYDQSIGWEKNLIHQISQIHQQKQIDWIFATGAPFNMLYHIAQWKSKHPGVKYWVDFRDPWLNAQNYGMPHLSETRKKQENNKALSVLKHAEVVSTPAFPIFHEFKDILSKLEKPPVIYELKHFYVGNEYQAIQPIESAGIEITYGGEIYIGLEPFINQLDHDLSKLKNEQPHIYQKLKFNFFVRDKLKLKRLSNHQNVFVNDVIGNQIEAIISKSSWCLILLAFHNKDFFTTKYFDFQKLQVPFLYLGESGLVEKKINEEHRGMSWNILFAKLLKGEIPNPATFNNAPNPSDSVVSRGEEIIALIKQVENENSITH